MRPTFFLVLLVALAALQPLAAFLALPTSTRARPSRGRIAASTQQENQQQPPPLSSHGRHHCSAAVAAATWSRHRQLKHAVAVVAGAAISTAALWGGGEMPAFAAVKASTQAEARAAALNVKGCLQGVKEMQRAANKGDWAAVRARRFVCCIRVILCCRLAPVWFLAYVFHAECSHSSCVTTVLPYSSHSYTHTHHE